MFSVTARLTDIYSIRLSKRTVQNKTEIEHLFRKLKLHKFNTFPHISMDKWLESLDPSMDKILQEAVLYRLSKTKQTFQDKF